MQEVKTFANATTSGPQPEANSRVVFSGWGGGGQSVPIRRLCIRFGISCLAVLFLARQATAGGMLLSPVQTRSTSPAGVLVATNWGSGTTGVTDPLAFNQFNPKLGELTSIGITLATNIRNDYIMMFPSNAGMTTMDLATSETTDASILSDPAKRALLTDGPSITLFAPDGTTQLFGGAGTRQPVDFVQMTEAGGTFSSFLPINDPNFIPPTGSQQLFTRTLGPADSPSLLSEFIGTGLVDLPVTATAFSSFLSESGNGGGAVMTLASATVTIQYNYVPVPEPSSLLLLGSGIAVGLFARRLCRRAACPS